MMPATGVDKSLYNRIQPVCGVLEHDASMLSISATSRLR